MGQRELAQKHLTLQRELLDKKVRLYQLEREAGRNPSDPEVREELAVLYAEIGLLAMEQFWRSAAKALRVADEP